MPYYLRFVVHDKPGILASIAAALASQGVNLDALLQEPGYPKDQLPFVITLEPCAEAQLHAALAEISEDRVACGTAPRPAHARRREFVISFLFRVT